MSIRCSATCTPPQKFWLFVHRAVRRRNLQIKSVSPTTALTSPECFTKNLVWVSANRVIKLHDAGPMELPDRYIKVAKLWE